MAAILSPHRREGWTVEVMTGPGRMSWAEGNHSLLSSNFQEASLPAQADATHFWSEQLDPSKREVDGMATQSGEERINSGVGVAYEIPLHMWVSGQTKISSASSENPRLGGERCGQPRQGRGIRNWCAKEKLSTNHGGSHHPSLLEESLSDSSGILLPWCSPFTDGDGCESSSNEGRPGPFDLHKVLHLHTSPSCQHGPSGNTLCNLEERGVERQAEVAK